MDKCKSSDRSLVKHRIPRLSRRCDSAGIICRGVRLGLILLVPLFPWVIATKPLVLLFIPFKHDWTC